jgi:hypothetical protein
MLRKAIEQNWSEPVDHVEAPTSPKTKDASTMFAAHFYAGYNGNKETPIAEGSANDLVIAEKFVKRLLGIWPDESKVADWGRQFGQSYRDHQRYKEKTLSRSF